MAGGEFALVFGQKFGCLVGHYDRPSSRWFAMKRSGLPRTSLLGPTGERPAGPLPFTLPPREGPPQVRASAVWHSAVT
jgi:hypothetical protein